jgi:molybdate transport system substrate-binding protein
MAADPYFTIRVLCTLGLRGVMTEIEPLLVRRGLYVESTFGATNLLLPKIALGEAADVAILTDDAIAHLTKQGTIAAHTPRNLALSAIGVAIASGSAKPYIRTIETLKQTLMVARSIAYSKSGASGLHFAEIIQRLGIAEEVRRKAKIIDGVIGELVARHEVELGVQQISELKLVQGIDIVGVLPDELQKVTTFTAGVFNNCPRPAAAGVLIAALASPEVAAVMRKQGLEPAPAVG